MTMMIHGVSSRAPSEPLLTLWWRTVDHWTILAAFALFGVGLLLSFSASTPLAEGNVVGQYFYVSKHAVFGAAACVLMLAISAFSPTMARRTGILLLLFAILGLMLLPFLGVDHGKNATRWLKIPGMPTFQPSEFLKPGFIIVCAWLIAGSKQVKEIPGIQVSFVLAVSLATVLALQPDFGQASLILFGWAVIYFAAGAPVLTLTLFALMTVTFGTVSYFASGHVASRIDAFLQAAAPHSQVRFSLQAIEEGGVFGVGLGNGTVKWSLADSHTDFIMAVAAEEYGLSLVIMVIILFAFIAVRSLSRLQREKDLFNRLAGTGLAALFAVQAFINIGVTSKLLPAKGMTLPFISYGGSSMIAVGLGLGLLLAFTRARPQGSQPDWHTSPSSQGNGGR